MAASSFEEHLTWRKVGENTGKSADSKEPTQPLTQPPLKCPECGSSRIWKDGLRYARGEAGGEIAVQRYICRDCGRRFSEDTALGSRMGSNPTNRRNIRRSESYLQPNNHVFNLSSGPSLCQVSVTETEGTKNLSHQRTRQKQAAGATTPDIKGTIVEYMWHLKKHGYREGTIERRIEIIKRLVKLGADLWDPESVKKIMAIQETWSLGTKDIVRQAYSNFVEMEGLTWQPPKYAIPEKLPFIPLQKEIALLINACGKRVSIFLQGLKETGADPGELLATEWIDLNEEKRIIAINHPVKGHNARILPVSSDFIGRLQLLPKKSQRIFSTTMNNMYTNFWGQRKRAAHSFNNPRIENVTFTSIRHWKATTEYHRTKDILHVKHLLGHKSLNSTMIYIDIERAIYGELRDDEFTVRVAKTLEEDRELIEVGFEYVTERKGAKIYRKRK